MSKSPVPPEMIELIVGHAFEDKMREDGAWDNTGRLPQGFLRLATVSKAFVFPVRRALYESLHIEAGERFLLLVGQLRVCPHLAQFVRTARLNFTCKKLTDMDGFGFGTRKPTRFIISDLPVVWFLDACLNLYRLFWRALKACDGSRRSSSFDATTRSATHFFWLAPIIAYPGLEELELVEYRLGHKKDPLEGLRGQSTCKMLMLVNIMMRLTTQSLVSLVAAMPRLEHLHLEIPALPRGELRSVLIPAAGTLKELVLCDYHSEAGGPDAWEVDVFASLPNLEVLALLSIPVRSTLFKHLPPALRHLQLSCLDFLPASLIIAWLKGRFEHPCPTLLETSGMLKRAVGSQDRATLEQMDEIRSLCASRGVKWEHDEGWSGDEFDDLGVFDIESGSSNPYA